MKKPNIAARRLARRFALQALYQFQFNPSSSQEIIVQFLEVPEMVSVDTHFFQELVKEILHRYPQLDDAMQPMLAKSDSTIQPTERAILWIGSYELKEHLNTPYRVVVNEAIELAKAFGTIGSHRYINGVLHALARQYRAYELS